MAWTCTKCGTYNLEGVAESASLLSPSKSSTTCGGCGQKRGAAGPGAAAAAARPVSAIQTTCIAMAASTAGVRILTHIDQSHDARLKSATTKSKYPMATSGVCSAMTAIWIQLHWTRPALVAQQTFAEMVDHQYDKFLALQQEEMLRIDQRKKLYEDAEGERQKYLKQQAELVKSIQAAKPGTSGGAGSLTLVSQEDIARKFRAVLNAAHKQEQRLGSGSVADATVVCSSADYELFVQSLANQMSIPGYYRLSLQGPGASIWRPIQTLIGLIDGTLDTGHVIGFRITATTCRMMDANTCDWETDSAATLYTLIKLVMAEFYNSDYGGGTYELLRY